MSNNRSTKSNRTAPLDAAQEALLSSIHRKLNATKRRIDAEDRERKKRDMLDELGFSILTFKDDNELRQQADEIIATAQATARRYRGMPYPA